ncbi:hypothetical protein [Bacillus phage phiAGATE]|uniref:Uncharacterized protein n=1 Tax=Bacillus phage phiAGATE TaxID=1204533 RepID=L0L994_9CAUD|nr:hypothetical protein G380_gp073 [Bacillus phage phiAGATE]AGB62723.1 hypothetical protein [Bacillus phage phiAGATE]
MIMSEINKSIHEQLQDINLNLAKEKSKYTDAVGRSVRLKQELQAVKFTEFTKRFPHLTDRENDNVIGVEKAAKDDESNILGYTMCASADSFEIHIEDDDEVTNFFKVDPMSLTVLSQLVEDAFAFHYGKKVKLTVAIDE